MRPTTPESETCCGGTKCGPACWQRLRKPIRTTSRVNPLRILIACYVLILTGHGSHTSIAGKVFYTYDAADRLVATDYGGGQSTTYTYDKNGNLLNRTTSASTDADVRISKISNFGGITVGFDLSYTLTVTNAGPDAANGVQVFDTLPFGMLLSSFGSSQGSAILSNRTVVGNLGTLPAGGSATILISAYHTSTNQATNVASVVSATADPMPGNNMDSQITIGLGPIFDSDGDGMANWWEELNGLNPFSSIGNEGADGDPDFDGISNFNEWLADTDPNDDASFPGIDDIVYQPTSATIFFDSSPTRLHAGQSSDALDPPAYVTFEVVPGSGLPMSLTDTNAVSTNLFYRLEYRLP